MILQGEGGGPSSAFQLEVSKSGSFFCFTVFLNVKFGFSLQRERPWGEDRSWYDRSSHPNHRPGESR